MPLGRVGVRISPYAKYNNVRDADPMRRSRTSAARRRGCRLPARGRHQRLERRADLPRIVEHARRSFGGTLIVNGGISPDAANALIDAGDADLVAFARAYIANPISSSASPHAPARGAENVGWYGGDRAGYVDYARHDAAESPA